ncbi:MAG: sugar ABC transporter permease [Firmicutes bacterium]|nr:sugar ABC transporter permease [Bacillota bacterium]
MSKSAVQTNQALPTPSRKTSLLVKINQQKYILLLLLPAFIWYVIFMYMPMAFSAVAFTDFGFSATINFVGWDNFIRLFNSPGFWNALENTLLISAYNLVFYFPLPIVLALLINEFRSVAFKRVVQFIVYIPHFFSWAVVGSIFVMLLSPRYGIMNELVKLLGHEPIYFFVSPTWFRSILVTSHIWRDVGYGAVIYIATLVTIDPELYDAAWVDGAGAWAKLIHITLPCLYSTIATVLLLQVASILRLFEQVLVMYNPAVYDVADVLNTYAFVEGLQNGDFGFATAISLFTSVTSTILVFGTNWLSKKFFHESVI